MHTQVIQLDFTDAETNAHTHTHRKYYNYINAYMALVPGHAGGGKICMALTIHAFVN